MKNVTHTIEDLLEIAAGLQGQAKIKIESSDITIMHSIARQVFKGTALTDRQFALMKEKLKSYRDQFTALEYNFDIAVDTLRQPLRYIDRSKYIKLVDNEITIRFPFRKTDIVAIQEFSGRSEGYVHLKGSHTHKFEFNEFNVLNLLDRFNKKEFEIDEELVEIYNKIKNIESNSCEYLSGISNNKLINIDSKLKIVIQKEVGEISNDNVIKLIDKKFRYAFDYIDIATSCPTSLSQKIAFRKSQAYNSKPSAESMSSILGALWELERFPMLVILDKTHAESQLYEFSNYYRDILQPEDQSVLFRLDDADAGFNQLVKDRKLNNWVDNSTKIVYISKDKLPKLLINGEWRPSVTFSYDSSMDRYVNSYVSFNCDLVVYREEETSPLRRYSRYYG